MTRWSQLSRCRAGRGRRWPFMPACTPPRGCHRCRNGSRMSGRLAAGECPLEIAWQPALHENRVRRNEDKRVAAASHSVRRAAAEKKAGDAFAAILPARFATLTSRARREPPAALTLAWLLEALSPTRRSRFSTQHARQANDTLPLTGLEPRQLAVGRHHINTPPCGQLPEGCGTKNAPLSVVALRLVTARRC